MSLPNTENLLPHKKNSNCFILDTNNDPSLQKQKQSKNHEL